MPRPDPSVLRVSLKTFLGEEKYRQFLEAGAQDPLRFWQERAWAAFTKRYPELSVTPTERADALNVCPKHEGLLQIGFSDLPGERDFRDTAVERKLFPRASLMPVLSSSGAVRFSYCTACTAERQKYYRSEAARQYRPES